MGASFCSGDVQVWARARGRVSGEVTGRQGRGLGDGLGRCRWNGWHGMVVDMHEGEPCPINLPPFQSSPIPVKPSLRGLFYVTSFFFRLEQSWAAQAWAAEAIGREVIV